MLTQNTTSSADPRRAPPEGQVSTAEVAATAPGGIKVIRRNGKLTSFDGKKISVAVTKAFLAVEGGAAAASAAVRSKVEAITQQVESALTRHMVGGGTLHIEDIQDQVELALMRAGEHKIARAYVLYRDEQARKRAAEAAQTPQAARPGITVKLDDGSVVALDEARMRRLVTEACAGLTGTDIEEVVGAALRDLYDGISETELSQALTPSARNERADQETNLQNKQSRPLRTSHLPQAAKKASLRRRLLRYQRITRWPEKMMGSAHKPSPQFQQQCTRIREMNPLRA